MRERAARTRRDAADSGFPLFSAVAMTFPEYRSAERHPLAAATCRLGRTMAVAEAMMTVQLK